MYIGISKMGLNAGIKPILEILFRGLLKCQCANFSAAGHQVLGLGKCPCAAFDTQKHLALSWPQFSHLAQGTKCYLALALGEQGFALHIASRVKLYVMNPPRLNNLKVSSADLLRLYLFCQFMTESMITHSVCPTSIHSSTYKVIRPTPPHQSLSQKSVSGGSRLDFYHLWCSFAAIKPHLSWPSGRVNTDVFLEFYSPHHWPKIQTTPQSWGLGLSTRFWRGIGLGFWFGTEDGRSCGSRIVF